MPAGCKVAVRIALISGLVVLRQVPAFAIQAAEIILPEASVYKSPSERSAKLSVLKKGTIQIVSSKSIKDQKGISWYKVKIPGGSGYIQNQSLRTASETKSLKAARVLASDPSETVLEAQFSDRAPWSYVLRVMGVGAADGKSGAFQFLGEGEFSICLPFQKHGYGHRAVSVGLFYLPFNIETIAGISGVFRIFTKNRIEPEIRLRLGQNLEKGGYLAGGTVGLDYPFTLNFESHLSGYLEAGSMVALNGATTWFWGSAGFGFHF
jgi:hypothetical protein